MNKNISLLQKNPVTFITGFFSLFKFLLFDRKLHQFKKANQQ